MKTLLSILCLKMEVFQEHFTLYAVMFVLFYKVKLICLHVINVIILLEIILGLKICQVIRACWNSHFISSHTVVSIENLIGRSLSCWEVAELAHLNAFFPCKCRWSVKLATNYHVVTMCRVRIPPLPHTSSWQGA
jgi:hypothetical protein